MKITRTETITLNINDIKEIQTESAQDVVALMRLALQNLRSIDKRCGWTKPTNRLPEIYKDLTEEEREYLFLLADGVRK